VKWALLSALLWLNLALAGTLSYASQLLSEGEPSLAALQIAEYLKAHPGSQRGEILLARAELLQGHPARASRELAKIPTITHPSGWWVKGLTLYELGHSRAALVWLGKAALQGQRYPYAMDWGTVAWQAGQVALAEQAYLLALQLEPTQAWPLIDSAMIAISQRQLSLAATFLSQAAGILRAHPNSAALPELDYWQGELAAKQGRTQQARADWKRALRLEPGDLEIERALDGLGN
jgi:Tfp pilus assembly protein PilF